MEEVFPYILKLINEKEIILFADEAVFSAGQIRPKIWYSSGEPLLIEKKRLAFKAMGAVAAVDVKGKVHGALV